MKKKKIPAGKKGMGIKALRGFGKAMKGSR